MICNTVIGSRKVTRERMGAAYYAYMDLLGVVAENKGSMALEYYRERAALLFEYELSLGSLCWSRVFCRTRNGYLGMVPAALAPGDVVCALQLWMQ